MQLPDVANRLSGNALAFEAVSSGNYTVDLCYVSRRSAHVLGGTIWMRLATSLLP